MGISTHVLDTSIGKPGESILVTLEKRSVAVSETVEAKTGLETLQKVVAIACGRTDADGRIKDLYNDKLEAGTYRITFHLATYFQTHNTSCLYPEVAVTFTVENPTQHYHIPLILSPYGYSTYRGT
eukprot:Platyproteum_vivax@DN8963_c0_g1_i1.p1